jgi:hypothetical protein
MILACAPSCLAYVPPCPAGLFSTLRDASLTLTTLLAHPPGSSTQHPGCAELLSCAVLELWRCCARIYRMPIIILAGMQATVLPVVQLSVAVLRCWPGPGPTAVPNGSASVSSSGASRRRGSVTRAVPGVRLDGAALLRQAATEAVCLADKLAFCLFDEVSGATGRSLLRHHISTRKSCSSNGIYCARPGKFFLNSTATASPSGAFKQPRACNQCMQHSQQHRGLLL